jgi:gluconolactonase
MTVDVTELTTGLLFPEGPVVLPDGDLLVCELKGKRVSRVPKGGGERTTIADCGGSPNGAALGPDGAIYVCNSGGWRWTEIGTVNLPGDHHGTQGEDYIGGRIQRVDLATGTVADLYTECDGNPLKAPNDLVFDATGGFWFTDHGHMRARDRDRGFLFYAQADGSSITEVVAGLDAPNGVGLSPDGNTVFVAETHTGRVMAWDLAGPGQLANPSPLFGNGGRQIHGGAALFDSLAVDGEGNVCVATLGNGGITVVAPDGSSSEHVPLPDPLTTNICFGGPDLRTAFATLSSSGRLVSFEWPRAGLALAF